MQKLKVEATINTLDKEIAFFERLKALQREVGFECIGIDGLDNNEHLIRFRGGLEYIVNVNEGTLELV